MLRSPVVLEHVLWRACRDCEHEATYSGHEMSREQCEAERPDGVCPKPSEHHPFRPRPRWRQLVRRAQPWESAI